MTTPVSIDFTVTGRQMLEYCEPKQMGPSVSEVTLLLRAWSAGDRTVEERLFELVLPELRVIARQLVSKERREHTLSPSALLNETYLRLLVARERDWAGRRHFFAIAARIMRRLLIDYARAHVQTIKVRVDVGAAQDDRADRRLEEAITIDVLLDELNQIHPQWCSVVELKYFLSLTDEEIADALDIPLRTVQRRFGDARRWLFQKLNPTTPCPTKTNATNS